MQENLIFAILRRNSILRFWWKILIFRFWWRNSFSFWRKNSILGFWWKTLYCGFIETLDISVLVEKIDFAILFRKLEFSVWRKNLILQFWRKNLIFVFYLRKTWLLVFAGKLDFAIFFGKPWFFDLGGITRFCIFSGKIHFFVENSIFGFYRKFDFSVFAILTINSILRFWRKKLIFGFCEKIWFGEENLNFVLWQKKIDFVDQQVGGEQWVMIILLLSFFFLTFMLRTRR